VLNCLFFHRYTPPASRWLYAWSLPLLLLLTLSLPLPASPSHPSDEKEHSSHFPRNISAASLGSLIAHHHNANHSHQQEPSVTDPLMGTVNSTGDMDTHIDMDKNELQVSLGLKCLTRLSVAHILHGLFCICWCFEQKEPTLGTGMHRSKSKHELKLLEKIPENAEATVVLVGEFLIGLRDFIDTAICIDIWLPDKISIFFLFFFLANFIEKSDVTISENTEH